MDTRQAAGIRLELCGCGHLLHGAEDVSVVLLEAANSGQARQRP